MSPHVPARGRVCGPSSPQCGPPGGHVRTDGGAGARDADRRRVRDDRRLPAAQSHLALLARRKGPEVSVTAPSCPDQHSRRRRESTTGVDVPRVVAEFVRAVSAADQETAAVCVTEHAVFELPGPRRVPTGPDGARAFAARHAESDGRKAHSRACVRRAASSFPPSRVPVDCRSKQALAGVSQLMATENHDSASVSGRSRRIWRLLPCAHARGSRDGSCVCGLRSRRSWP